MTKINPMIKIKAFVTESVGAEQSIIFEKRIVLENGEKFSVEMIGPVSVSTLLEKLNEKGDCDVG